MKTNRPPKDALSPLLTQRLDKHLAGCSAAALGVVSLMGLQGTAQAQIVYSGIQNLPVHSGGGGLYFDFENPANFAQDTRPNGWDSNPYTSGTRLYVNGNAQVVVSGANAVDLAPGTLIGSGSAFSPGGWAGGSGVAAGSTGIIGFSFDPDSVSGVQTWYGWFRMSAGSGTADGAVVDWAYDNTGAPIAALAVPEPSLISLLALGTTGLLALRRRRAQA